MSESGQADRTRRPGTFAHRVRMAVAIVAAVVVLLALAWRGLSVLLLAFAGVLFAVLLVALATPLRRRTGWPHGAALALVVLLLVALAVGVVWLAAPSVSRQVDQLAQTLPRSFADLQSWLSSREWGRWVLARTPELGQELVTGGGEGAAAASGEGAETAGGEGAERAGGEGADAAAGREGAAGAGGAGGLGGGDVVSRVTGIASTVLAAITGFLIILFLGLYLAAEPGLYTAGIVRLVPRRHRERAREVLAKLYETLKWWLVARFASMAVIGVLTWIGLAALGIPLSFILAVLAAILTFIPYVGPVLSALIPALLALAQGPMKALWVIVLFLAIQTVESYLITPLIERKAVRLPPALTITAQVLFTLIAGPLGLLLADPLLAVLMVLVQMLYVEDALGDELPHVGAER